VLDHKLGRADAFSEGSRDEAVIADLLLGKENVPLAVAAAYLG